MRYAAKDESRSCRGKMRHASEATAMRALVESMKTFGVGDLIYYGCRFCGGYHIGHAPTKSERKQLRFDRLIKLIDRANES